MEKLLFTVEEAATTLLCSRRRVFQLLARGVLVRGAGYGKRTAILAESVFAAAEKSYDPAPVKVPRKRARGAAALEARLDAMFKEVLK